MERVIHRVVKVIDDGAQDIPTMGLDEARTHLFSEQQDALLAVRGSFAFAAGEDETVFMARSLDWPMRYFLAQEAVGPSMGG